jgi:hypothetical protein
MIMQSVGEFADASTGAARRAAEKLEKHRLLWDLASEVLKSIDPEYAKLYTALAVTKGFRGSPHIDKQNTLPFYGLSIGDFADGEGGVCVEYDPFTVVQVNTKNRLGKVDGRFPHWVAPYDQSKVRFSLIYYCTTGQYVQPTVAVTLPPGLVL